MPLLSLGEPRWTSHTDTGVFRLWKPAPGAVVSQCVGRLATAHSDQIINQLARCLEQGEELRQWHDWGATASYEIACQRDLTVWHARHLRDVKSLMIHTESFLVRAGVSVANIALGGRIVLVDNVEGINTALSQALAA